MFQINHITATLAILFTILGALTATSLGWKYRARVRQQPTESRWRSLVSVIALSLVTLSVLLFAAYVTRNALIRGDRNGSLTMLIFIRVGNYLSLIGALGSLTGKGKTRWPTFVGACLMLFIWFSEGMSL